MKGTIISFAAFLITVIMISQLATPMLPEADNVVPTEIPLEEGDDDPKKQDYKDKLFQITQLKYIRSKNEHGQYDLITFHCFEIARDVVPPPPKG